MSQSLASIQQTSDLIMKQIDQISNRLSNLENKNQKNNKSLEKSKEPNYEGFTFDTLKENQLEV